MQISDQLHAPTALIPDKYPSTHLMEGYSVKIVPSGTFNNAVSTAQVI